MLEHIFRIKVNGQVIYEKDNLKNCACTQTNFEKIYKKNISICETIPNKEVIKYARHS